MAGAFRAGGGALPERQAARQAGGPQGGGHQQPRHRPAGAAASAAAAQQHVPHRGARGGPPAGAPGARGVRHVLAGAGRKPYSLNPPGRCRQELQEREAAATSWQVPAINPNPRNPSPPPPGRCRPQTTRGHCSRAVRSEAPAWTRAAPLRDAALDAPAVQPPDLAVMRQILNDPRVVIYVLAVIRGSYLRSGAVHAPDHDCLLQESRSWISTSLLCGFQNCNDGITKCPCGFRYSVRFDKFLSESEARRCTCVRKEGGRAERCSEGALRGRGPQEFQSKAKREGAVGTLVRSGLWEVDLLLRLMSPCYWPEVRGFLSVRGVQLTFLDCGFAHAFGDVQTPPNHACCSSGGWD